MVAEYTNSSYKEKDLKSIEKLTRDVKNWLRPLQLALTLEAEKGFLNIQGREKKFHSFIATEIVNFDLTALGNENENRLTEFSSSFDNYPSISIQERRRLIIDTRQFLYNLSKNFDPPDQLKPPTIRLSEANNLSTAKKAYFSKNISLRSLLAEIKGIGPKYTKYLSSLGIHTVQDILLHYPREYVDYSNLLRINELKAGQTATIVATVRRCSSFVSPRNPNLSILDLHVQDVTGRIKVTRYFAGRKLSNRSYLKKQSSQYTPGVIVAVSGLVKDSSYGIGFNDPFIEVLENKNSPLKSKNIGRMLAIYSVPEGINVGRFRDLIDIVLPLASGCIDPIPKNNLMRLNLLSKEEAIFNIHQPKDQKSLQQARRRIVFDEFLLMQLGLLRRRNFFRRQHSPPLISYGLNGNLVNDFFGLLPFSLTKSQKKVFEEIKSDIYRSEPMARLIQGDVGSGKTIIAIASLLSAVQSGWQSAFMAPTEVLAQQHYRNLCKWLPHLNVTVELLTGSTPSIKRRHILDDLSSGNLKILVGTHALIEDYVAFSRLGLVVVDEQHRFGVHQRNKLLSKGIQPHLLTMTATPIPRTLALSIHGDLDVSQITELPPGRTPIKTSVFSNNQREAVYEIVKQEIIKGQQAYIVLPLIEESEKIELRSAMEVHKELSSDIFSNFNVGLLHGRMNSNEKKLVIDSFMNHEIQILVSTTVIEVGVDVPEATVMVIDHADRFGLAQLHQLRGRVGRGTKSSKCLLINASSNSSAKDRLNVLVNSNDGFEISEIDLRLRGPGQVLGTRQSGLPDFALASLIDDVEVLNDARSEALSILKEDPDLTSNETLRDLLEIHWKRLIGNSHLN